METAPDATPLARPRPPLWQRALWLLAGWLALVTGIVGIFLPLLPTTPFVLLAAFCFSRGSERWEAWMLNHPRFGPMVRDWEAHRSLTRRSKRIAQGSMLVMVGLSAWGLRERPVVLAVVLIAAAIGVWVVARIPTREP